MPGFKGLKHQQQHRAGRYAWQSQMQALSCQLPRLLNVLLPPPRRSLAQRAITPHHTPCAPPLSAPPHTPGGYADGG